MNMAAAYALRKAEYGLAVRTSMRDAVHRICSVVGGCGFAGRACVLRVVLFWICFMRCGRWLDAAVRV